MPRPIPPFLISILQPCVEHGATHVDIGRERIVLHRGEDTIGDAPSPEGQFDEIVDLIRSFSEPSNDGAFEARKAVFHSPFGPLPVDVEIHSDVVRLVFSKDARATRAESVFNATLTEAMRLGAQRLVFAPAGVAFWKDNALEAVAAIDAALLPDLVTFARKLGSMEQGKRKGMAVMMGEGRAMTLTLEIVEADRVDTIVVTRSG